MKSLKSLNIPDEKVEIFVKPEYAEWKTLLRKNAKLFPIVASLSDSRQELFNAAKDYTHSLGLPASPYDFSKQIIATGHQTSWHHCGTLAKNAVVNGFAKKVNAFGIHIVLDHDICKMALTIPESVKKGFWKFTEIEFNKSHQTFPAEFVSAPTIRDFADFTDTIAENASTAFCNTVWSEYIASNHDTMPSFKNAADFVTFLQALLHIRLGIDLTYLPVSHMCRCSCFHEFVTSVILNAPEFTKIYNHAIFEEIHSNNAKPSEIARPLLVNESMGAFELPFWLMSPEGQRMPLYVKSESNNEIAVGTTSMFFGKICPSGKNDQLQQILQKQDYQLHPKAITLTLFIRLFLADWFVHGIGGAKYEKISAHIMRNFYKIRAPDYGIATATMTLPHMELQQGSDLSVPELKLRLRKIKFNPELFIDGLSLQKMQVRALLSDKRKLLVISRNKSLPSKARHLAWQSISKINQALLPYAKNRYTTLTNQLKTAENHHLSCQVKKHREFFFGLFPEISLRTLVEKADQW